MKRLIFILILLLFTNAVAEAQNGGFVRVQNNELRGGDNRKIYLNGVNFGNWLLWEGWMSGGGFTKESDIKARLREMLGAADYQNFLDEYYRNFITEADVRQVAANGFNVIRLPVNYRIFEGGETDGFTLLDDLIAWCERHKIYLIIDLHSAPGGQTPYFIADPSGASLWESEANRRQTLEIWKKIAARYRDKKIIAGYDLLNEPDVKDSKILIAFYAEIIKAVRSQDKNHLLIVEGNKLAKDFTGFPAKMDDNQIYSYHYYTWFGENNKRKPLQSIVKTLNSNLPLWCGEWGEDTPPNLSETAAVIRELPNDAGMSFWTWKKVAKDNKHLSFYSINAGGEWQKVIDWACKQRLFKPTKNEIKRGTEDFLRAIRIDDCTFNRSTKTALNF